MTPPKLLKHIDGAICTLTLNRPAIHNAFDEELITLLITALDDIAEDDTIRIVLLAANGKSFCAGADLNWMRKMILYSHEENKADAMALATLMNKLHTSPKITLAKVQGAAFGGGVGLVCCCDIAIASDNALFCFSEAKLGLAPSVISPYVCKAIGARQASRYFLTAEHIDANTAKTIQLIHEVVTSNELDRRVKTLCNGLLNNGTACLPEIKKLIHSVNQKAIDAALMTMTAEHIAKLRIAQEGQQRLQAFLDRQSD